MKRTKTRGWNREVYGEATLTGEELVETLKAEGCIDKKGRVVLWKEFMTVPNIITAENEGLVRFRAGPHYNHMDLFVISTKQTEKSRQ